MSKHPHVAVETIRSHAKQVLANTSQGAADAEAIDHGLPAIELHYWPAKNRIKVHALFGITSKGSFYPAFTSRNDLASHPDAVGGYVVGRDVDVAEEAEVIKWATREFPGYPRWGVVRHDG